MREPERASTPALLVLLVLLPRAAAKVAGVSTVELATMAGPQ